MTNYSNIPGGLKIPSQIPLNAKGNIESEAVLKDLGTNNNLAFTYEKGLIVYCISEGTRYEWKNVNIGAEDTGLLTTDFIYPDGLIANGIDYSLKRYNFFKVNNEIYIESGENTTVSGDGLTPETPYIINANASPFTRVDDGFKPTIRDEINYNDTGTYSYDFALAKIGANDDPFGQIGQIGVSDPEYYGATGDYGMTIGFNNSLKSHHSFIHGKYNQSTVGSDKSTIFGNNNHNESINGFISGSFNKSPRDDKGYSTIIGNGNNVVNGVNFTLGFALNNYVAGLTVIGQANSSPIGPSETLNNPNSPIYIIGNGDVTSSVDGMYTASVRSNAMEVYKRGLILAPSLTNSMLDEPGSVKALITKEYLNFVVEESIDSLNVSQDLEYETIWNTGDSNTFTIPSYNFISGVFRNGVKLSFTKFTTPSTTTVTLLDTLLDDDLIQIQYSQYINGLDLGTYTISQIDNKFLNYYDKDQIDDINEGFVLKNTSITGATKTKITYDTKGLVVSGEDATTVDIADSTNKRYQTDNQRTFNDATSSIQTQINSKQNLLTQGDGISIVGNTISSFTSVISKTYSELLIMITNNELIKGQTYLLTDYVTTYTQPVTLSTKNSGITEQLYLTATDTNKFSKICRSKLYPQDTIYYEITGDIGDGAGTEGFTKGKIYRRIDNIRNNDIGTDWRHVKYSRGIDKLLFEDYTNCYNNVIKCMKLIDTVVGNNFNNNILRGSVLTNTIGNNFINNDIGDDFRSNTISTGMNNNTIGYKFVNNNIGVDFFYNNIGNEFLNNTTDGVFAQNKIGHEFRGNTVGSGFQINFVNYYFLNNNIGVNCAHNIFQNYTSLNTIGNFFGLNKTGNDFRNNTIGNNFSYNDIKPDFKFNIVDINFINNNIEYNFSNNNVGTDFTGNDIDRGWIYKTIGNNVRNNNFTVATLPTGLTLNQRLIVTDALTPTYLSAVVGGGTVITPVIWNGTNWICN